MSRIISSVGQIVNYAMNSLDQFSCANDVIVVQHRDGRLVSNGWTVRFGRAKVLRPQDKLVQIEVNGKMTRAVMKIDREGTAYWLEPVDAATVAAIRQSKKKKTGSGLYSAAGKPQQNQQQQQQSPPAQPAASSTAAQSPVATDENGGATAVAVPSSDTTSNSNNNSNSKSQSSMELKDHQLATAVDGSAADTDTEPTSSVAHSAAAVATAAETPLLQEEDPMVLASHPSFQQGKKGSKSKPSVVEELLVSLQVEQHLSRNNNQQQEQHQQQSPALHHHHHHQTLSPPSLCQSTSAEGVLVDNLSQTQPPSAHSGSDTKMVSPQSLQQTPATLLVNNKNHPMLQPGKGAPMVPPPEHSVPVHSVAITTPPKSPSVSQYHQQEQHGHGGSDSQNMSMTSSTADATLRLSRLASQTDLDALLDAPADALLDATAQAVAASSGTCSPVLAGGGGSAQFGPTILSGEFLADLPRPAVDDNLEAEEDGVRKESKSTTPIPTADSKQLLTDGSSASISVQTPPVTGGVQEAALSSSTSTTATSNTTANAMSLILRRLFLRGNRQQQQKSSDSQNNSKIINKSKDLQPKQAGHDQEAPTDEATSPVAAIYDSPPDGPYDQDDYWDSEEDEDDDYINSDDDDEDGDLVFMYDDEDDIDVDFDEGGSVSGDTSFASPSGVDMSPAAGGTVEDDGTSSRTNTLSRGPTPTLTTPSMKPASDPVPTVGSAAASADGSGSYSTPTHQPFDLRKRIEDIGVDQAEGQQHQQQTHTNNETTPSLRGSFAGGNGKYTSGGGSSHHRVHRKKKYFRKTIFPTPLDLLKLNLNEGANALKFYTGTTLRGRVEVECRVFLWPSTTKIVVSDIDGTISKSDVLGHVASYFGKDWTHPGLCALFHRVANNGFRFVYVTARSCSQVETTRAFIKGVEQDGLRLPDGPVLTAPDRLFTATVQELGKKSHEFKIMCLNQIRKAFIVQPNIPLPDSNSIPAIATTPGDGNGNTSSNTSPASASASGLGLAEQQQQEASAEQLALLAEHQQQQAAAGKKPQARGPNPFYAGFGNRVGDVVAYTASNIPPHKIFIINKDSVVHVCQVRKSYKDLSHLVDETFPPLRPKPALPTNLFALPFYSNLLQQQQHSSRCTSPAAGTSFLSSGDVSPNQVGMMSQNNTTTDGHFPPMTTTTTDLEGGSPVGRSNGGNGGANGSASTLPASATLPGSTSSVPAYEGMMTATLSQHGITSTTATLIDKKYDGGSVRTSVTNNANQASGTTATGVEQFTSTTTATATASSVASGVATTAALDDEEEDLQEDVEFNNFNFWRKDPGAYLEPVSEKPALPAVEAQKAQQAKDVAVALAKEKEHQQQPPSRWSVSRFWSTGSASGGGAAAANSATTNTSSSSASPENAATTSPAAVKVDGTKSANK